MTEALEKKVRVIDLSGQQITTIGSEVFQTFRKCRYVLDLSNNLIDSIEPKAFDHFTGWLKLNLNGNKLRQIPTQAFSGMLNGFLHNLSISNNLITTVKMSEVTQLPFDDSEPSPTLRLDLSHNPLENMVNDGNPSYNRKVLNGLKILNVSHTRLIDVPEGFVHDCLIILDMSSTRLNRLKGAAFSSMGSGCLSWQRITVDISNNTLEKVDENTFSKTEHIGDLNMARCTLKELPQHILSFKPLTFLDLSHNAISDFHLPDQVGSKQFNLERLLLAGNKLETLPDAICDRFPNLSTVDVFSNPMIGDLSEFLDKFEKCNKSKEFAVYWPGSSMKCTCQQFEDWYGGRVGPNVNRRLLIAYNCEFPHGKTCTPDKQISCSGLSDKVLQGSKVNDLGRKKVYSLCSSSASVKETGIFVAVLVLLVTSFNPT